MDGDCIFEATATKQTVVNKSTAGFTHHLLSAGTPIIALLVYFTGCELLISDVIHSRQVAHFYCGTNSFVIMV